MEDYCTLKNKYKFGLMQKEEAEKVYESFDCIANNFDCINILEIGVWNGETGTAFVKMAKNFGMNCNYFGIDTKKPEIKLLQEMKVIVGNANNPEVVERLPRDLHFILVDACHCFDCVVNQFKIYSPLIVENGIIAFHDTAELVQGDPMSASCDITKDKFIDVVTAIKSLDLSGFVLYREAKSGHGIKCYRKVSGENI
ncbi:MAG: class I SAM-dependent methyltransferase [Elusimicrobiota bacterium]